MNQRDMVSVLRTLKSCHSIEGEDILSVSPRNKAGVFGWKPQGI